MKSRLLDPWPLDDRDMSASDRERLERAREQSPELEEALGAWQAIEAALQEAAVVGPAPGFAQRWRLKLAEKRERRRQRLVRWLLAGLLMGALAALSLISLEVLSSPAQIGAAWLETIVRVGQILEAGARFMTILGDGWPALLGSLGLSTALAWLSVLWVVAMYRYGIRQVQNGVS